MSPFFASRQLPRNTGAPERREADRLSGTMTDTPTIGSVMTRAPYSVDIDLPLPAAEDMMIDEEVRHLPVTDNGALVGVLSDRDVSFLANTPGADAIRNRLKVRDVCALNVYSVGPDQRLDEVLEQMAERRIGSVIVTEGEEITGVFTATDACRRFAEFLKKPRS